MFTVNIFICNKNKYDERFTVNIIGFNSEAEYIINLSTIIYLCSECICSMFMVNIYSNIIAPAINFVFEFTF